MFIYNRRDINVHFTFSHSRFCTDSKGLPPPANPWTSANFVGSRSMLARFSRYEHAIKTIRSTIRGVLEVRNGKKLATLICDKCFYGECGKDD